MHSYQWEKLNPMVEVVSEVTVDVIGKEFHTPINANKSIPAVIVRNIKVPILRTNMLVEMPTGVGLLNPERGFLKRAKDLAALELSKHLVNYLGYKIETNCYEENKSVVFSMFFASQPTIVELAKTKALLSQYKSDNSELAYKNNMLVNNINMLNTKISAYKAIMDADKVIIENKNKALIVLSLLSTGFLGLTLFQYLT